MVTTIIVPCSCKHQYQDRLYGAGNRVHNDPGHNGAGNKNGKSRCTVCEQTKK